MFCFFVWDGYKSDYFFEWFGFIGIVNDVDWFGCRRLLSVFKVLGKFGMEIVFWWVYIVLFNFVYLVRVDIIYNWIVKLDVLWCVVFYGILICLWKGSGIIGFVENLLLYWFYYMKYYKF